MDKAISVTTLKHVSSRISGESVSDDQAKFMRIACKDPEFAKQAGIPQNVACEFYEEDQKAGVWNNPKKPNV